MEKNIIVMHVRDRVPQGFTPVYVGRAMPGREGSVFGNPLVVRSKSWSAQARDWAEWLSGLEDAEASEAGRRALACRGFLRGEAAALYRTVLREQVKVGGPQRRELLTLAARLRGGERLALQCWCYPRPCHAAVIREAVLGYAGRL